MIVAIVAMYALLLQAILCSFTMIPHGWRGAGETFAASICWSGTEPSPAGLPSDRADGKHGACCILCSMPGLGSTREGFSSAGLTDRMMPHLWVLKSFAFSRATIDRLPGSPRAPPAFAIV